METYNTWQGTYASVFLFALTPAVFGTQYYFVTAWLMLALLVLGIMRLLSVVIGDCLGKSKADVWLFGSLLLILITQFAPSVKEMFFWYNGAVHYLGFFSVMLLDIAEHLLFLRDGKRRRIVLMSLYAFLLGGGNLVTALLSAELTVLVLAYAAWRKRDRLLPLLIPAVILFAGFLASVLAPGNALRELYYGRHNSILLSILQSFGLAFQTIPTYLNTYVGISMLLFIPLTYYLVRDLEFSFPLPGVVCLMCYLILTSSYAPTMYGMDGIGGRRIENIRYAMFLLLSLLCIAYVEGWILQKLREEGLADRVHAFIGKMRIKYGMVLTVSVLMCLVCCVGLARGKRYMATTGALKELISGEAKAFQEECLAREALLLTDDPVVALPPIKNRPDLLFMADIVEDGGDLWINEDMAEFYGKEQILLEK